MDRTFMLAAMEEARAADFPYGAVIVYNGKIVSRAGTAKRKGVDPTAHAEMTAIRSACRKMKTKSLKRATLYTTCEPCPMCFTASVLAGVDTIIYGMTLKDSSKLFFKEISITAKELDKRSPRKLVLKEFMRKEVLTMFVEELEKNRL